MGEIPKEPKVDPKVHQEIELATLNVVRASRIMERLVDNGEAGIFRDTDGAWHAEGQRLLVEALAVATRVAADQAVRAEKIVLLRARTRKNSQIGGQIAWAEQMRETAYRLGTILERDPPFARFDS